MPDKWLMRAGTGLEFVALGAGAGSNERAARRACRAQMPDIAVGSVVSPGSLKSAWYCDQGAASGSSIGDTMTYSLEEYVPGRIFIVEYPIRYGGLDLFSRMTLVKLSDGKLWVHSPCKVDAELKSEIDQLGEVAYILAPGDFHHLYVADFQSTYPNAETFLCPGLEKKRADLRFDWILGNQPDHRWCDEFEQVVIQGTRIISEVAFLHTPTKTLILVDLLENIGDDYTHEAGALLKFWWKAVFHMWNNPKAAPEYQVAWGDKKIVRKGLEKILSWEFERIIIAHGNLIEVDAKAVAAEAWKKVLKA